MVVVLATNTVLGLDVKYWFGFICMGMAVLLVIAQLIQGGSNAPLDPAAKASLEGAAKKVQDAAEKAQEAVAKAALVRGLHQRPEVARLLGSISVDQSLYLAEASESETAARAKADEATQAATDAGEKVTAATLTSTLDTISTKVPLVGGAILLVLIGAWISGYITISFG